MSSYLYRLGNQLKSQGLSNTLKDLWSSRRLKAGTLRGVDSFGNRYYEADVEHFIRHRWVIYSNKQYDASQIPPEWHMWIHHIADEAPQSRPQDVEQVESLSQEEKWLKPHRENQTWTSKRYMPPGSFYRQERKDYLHYEPWVPTQKK
jgi:NADH:ubiquinone oxidoreductase subunit